MKRKIYDQLVNWKQDGAGKTALLIDGARRVGKSYVAEEFAKAEYKSYLLIDFNRVGDEVKDLFLHYLNDLDTLFMYLSGYYNVKLYEHESLIILTKFRCSLAHGRLSSIWLRMAGTIIWKQGHSCPSRKMSKISSSHPRNGISRCTRWILRNFCGRWAMIP